MEKVIRNVAEIDAADRLAIVHLIGMHLAEHQQVIISIVTINIASHDASQVPASNDVPAWWNVYEGLSDEDVDRLDQSVRRRADLTRVAR